MASLVEICVDTPDGLQAAIDGGADRIELCSSLALGGLTPSAGLIDAASRGSTPTLAMIRPRAGDFCWSAPERRAMRADIAAIRSAGLHGVVLGASRPDGTLDTETLATLVSDARGLSTTLHRCFDLTPDPFTALEQAIALGFDRILTSGQADMAASGLPLLAELNKRAAGRIVILPAGGIIAENARLFGAAGLRELHASCSVGTEETERISKFGFGPAVKRTTSAALVAALVAAARGE